MPRFAANLHYLFNEVPFLDRFAAAASAGFQGVEFQVPYDWPAPLLSGLLKRHDLELALIDTPQGDWGAGERGLTALPGREAEFRAGVRQAAEYAGELGAGAVHLIAGVLPPSTDLEAARATYLSNLEYGATLLGECGVAAVTDQSVARANRRRRDIHDIRHARLLSDAHPAGHRGHRCGESSKPAPASRSLSFATHRRAPGGYAAHAHASYPASADRRRAGTQRAGSGRDQLSVSLRPDRLAWLRRVGWLRISPGGRHVRGTWMGGALRHPLCQSAKART